MCKCGETDQSKFGKNKSHWTGLTQYCKNCWEQYRKLNEIKMDSYYKEYYKAHKEELLIKNAMYQQNHRKQFNAYNSKYRKANKAKVAAICRKRQASKILRTPKWMSSLMYSHIEQFYDAAINLTKEFGVKMVVDHIVPLQGKNVSGLHVPWNLQVITKLENDKKGNKWP